MSDPKNNGLAAILYGASTVRARVGINHEVIEIHQETDYPFGEEIQLTIHAARPVDFPLALRIPAWCEAPRLALNGKTLTLPEIKNGFIKLAREFLPDDRITLTLPMQLALSYWPGNGVGIEHGPLVYALSVKEEWSPIVTPKWSTAEYPEWNANAISEWRFGTAVEEMKILSSSNFERKPMTKDPWIDPPVSLTVPLKKIPGWELTRQPNHPDRIQTPPLPLIEGENAEILNKVSAESIALVPYGATHLRVSIFPEAV